MLLVIALQAIIITQSCNSGTDDELNRIINDKTVVVQEEEVTSSIQYENKDEDAASSQLSEIDAGTYKVSYIRDTADEKYDVEYILFKNQHHPNGYAMISTIEVAAPAGTTPSVFSIPMVNDPAKYASNIHVPSEVKAIRGITDSDDYLTLLDKPFRELFRTAEAMVAVQLHTGSKSVTEGQLIEARKAMDGRQYGVPIQ